MSYLYHQMPHAPPAGSWNKQDKGGSPANRLSITPPRENGRVSASPPAGSLLLQPLRRFSHQTDRTTLRPRDPTWGGGVTGERTVGDRSRVASRESPTLPSVSSAHTVLRGRRDPRLPPLPIGPICPQSSGDTRPTSFSRNQPRRRRSLLEPHTSLLPRTAESSPRDGVLRCVRPRIDRLASVGRVRAIASLMRANATEIWIHAPEHISRFHIDISPNRVSCAGTSGTLHS